MCVDMKRTQAGAALVEEQGGQSACRFRVAGAPAGSAGESGKSALRALRGYDGAAKCGAECGRYSARPCSRRGVTNK